MAKVAEELRAHRRVVVAGLPPSGLAYLVATELEQRPLVVVTATQDRAERVALDLAALGVKDVTLLPGEAHAPHEEVSPDPLDVAARLALRARLLAGDHPNVVVLPASALLLRWPPRDAFESASFSVRTGEEVDREDIARKLVRAGYARTNLVEDEGTFAVRGGVIDIYAPGAARPIRLDLFGDEVASIKRFDPETQRTFESEPRVHVAPMREVVFEDESIARAVTVLRAYAEQVDIPTRRISQVIAEIEARHYFFGIESLWPAFYAASEAIVDTLLSADTTVALDDEEQVLAALEEYSTHAQSERARAIERHHVALPLELFLSPVEVVRTRLAAAPALVHKTLADDRADRPYAHGLTDLQHLGRAIERNRKDPSQGEILDPLVLELRSRFEKGQAVWLLCGSRGSAERMRELLSARKIDLPIVERLSLGKKTRGGLVVAALGAGLVDPTRGVALITEAEIFGGPTGRTSNRKRPRPTSTDTLRDLREGDFVIHVDHGVGRYLGLVRLATSGVDADYVHLEYQDGDKLYLPIYRLSLLQRYRGPLSDAKLDKLGGTRWQKAKARVKDAVLALAHELLAVQAQRTARPGFALPAPDEHFRSFEARFPYEETPDQQRAIDEVLGDLTKDTPMDRLVCGDVGFGKTEVAMRAAFLAVLGKKQVAVLVPTTVLAEQHGETFKERLGPLGVSVEVVSRFRSSKDIRAILERARDGKLDILIGTHRLLSADVTFKDLGLLVVDEEQRFGVKHKERIKQFRSHVHVLTLTATPIPRTMHMATVGLRDLSIIQTPPPDRSAIRTEVTRFDEELIAEAIRRELVRGGQVFVVHNRVRSIQAMAELVARLVPEARVGMAHGQMEADTLEEIMVAFVHKELNVLVATAIIESGIDIPSANTMIVNRADMFGLAQLHQLRGRIGRGRERAYAYLLLPRSDKITKEASERLAVLKRFSDLGSGFQIATHDLDLRGAGDLLGSDQSGNIQAVGFELYTQLLAEAVEQVKGGAITHAVEPDIKLPVPAVLPESYVPEPMQRLAYYQRLAQASSDEVIFNIAGEIRDLYGEPPDEARNLTEVMVIRRRLLQLGAIALSADVVNNELRVGVMFAPEAPVDREHLASELVRDPARYRLLPSGRLVMTSMLTQAEVPPLSMLRAVREALAPLRRKGLRVVA